MALDIPTLFIVSSCILGMLGFFLFFAWFQDKNIRALAWWGAAYMLGGLGVALWIAEAALTSESHPYGFSNALLFAAAGTIWSGARLFFGRKVMPLALCAGAIAWIVACQIPAFAESDAAHVVLSSVIAAVYAFATAREIWSDRRKRTRSRWAAVCVPFLHGLVFLSPVPLAVLRTGESSLLSSGWVAIFTLETLLYVVGTAFIALMMAKERAESHYRVAAATDPLTGLLNRRGFMERAQDVINRAAGERGDVGLLMFDLDFFKSINDRYGHAAGDEALRMFAETIRSTMREGDVIGRLGGEEFAALVPEPELAAKVAAERVRAAFEKAGKIIADHEMRATVSIGLASVSAKGCDIEAALSRADAALYQAKESGRNRVVCAEEEQTAKPAQQERRKANDAVLAPAGLPRAA